MKTTNHYILAALISATIVVISSCAFIDRNPENKQAEQRVLKSLPLPPVNQETVRSLPTKFHESWLTHTIRRGETLSSIFSNYNIAKRTLHKIVSTGWYAKELATVHPGKTLEILLDDVGRLQRLNYHQNRLNTLEVQSTPNGYEAFKVAKNVEKQITHAHTTINSSLFSDAKAAGLSDKLVMEIAQIFAWDIDFALDLKRGDEFTVIYEQLYVDGEKIGSGAVLATEFINKSKSHVAVRYQSSDGSANYFTPDGKSLRKAFLRTPVKFARISSHFNLKRRHPVLNKIRAHKGVDYAAPTGTPIRTTGNGKVVFRGRRGGYGRAIIVQHGKKYATLYAHLSSFKKNVKTGTKVTQGQTIGYVGKSGLATGPHLHYEFRVDGRHTNPLTVQLPKATPIDKANYALFKKRTTPILSQLASLKSNLLAQADKDTVNSTVLY